MNKIKIADRVQLKSKCHSWHIKYLIDNFLRPGSTEFEKQNFEEIALLLGSKSRRTKLKGKVVSYGAADDEFKGKRNFVLVVFQWKDLNCNFYCSEKDLKRL